MKQTWLLLLLMALSIIAEAQLSKEYDYTVQLDTEYFFYTNKRTQELGDTARIDFFTRPTYKYGITYNKFISRNYQFSLGTYYDNRKFLANYSCSSCDSILVKTDEEYDVNYLSVPINFHFILYEDIHSFYFKLGVAMNFLLNGERQVYNLNNEVVTVGLSNSLKNNYTDVLIGLDYKVQISDSAEILLGLEVVQAAKSIMNNFAFKNKRYGISAGLVMGF